MDKIAPQDIRQHLMLNQSLAQETEDYWDATEEFSRDDKGQAGFIAPVGKGPAKVENLMECHTTVERVVARRAKDKRTKGLGFQPERGEQRKFGGYCHWCWRIGHKEAQFWFKQEYMKSNPSQAPLQRDFRERSNTSEKGQGHSQPKGKGKGKGNRKHQDKGTTIRTWLDLRMKMDSARWVILV